MVRFILKRIVSMIVALFIVRAGLCDDARGARVCAGHADPGGYLRGPDDRRHHDRLVRDREDI